jgi:hypothetical protein
MKPWKVVVAAVLAFALGVAWDMFPHPLLGWALFAALVVLLWSAFTDGAND